MSKQSKSLPSIQYVTPDAADEWVNQRIATGSLVMAMYLKRSEVEAMLAAGQETAVVSLDLPQDPSKSVGGVMTSY